MAMNKFFNIDFGLALKRMLGGEKRAEHKAEISPHDDRQSEAEVESPIILTIWTIERSRTAPPRALSTDIEVYPSAATVLCEDIAGYVVGTPNGETVVIEARTGGLVGHTLEVVLDGVREMTRSQLNSQLDTAKKEFNRMKKVEMANDEFWKAIKMGSEEMDATQINPEYHE